MHNDKTTVPKVVLEPLKVEIEIAGRLKALFVEREGVKIPEEYDDFIFYLIEKARSLTQGEGGSVELEKKMKIAAQLKRLLPESGGVKAINEYNHFVFCLVNEVCYLHKKEENKS